MEAIQGTRDRRVFLDKCMNERRLELRFKWVEVARRAGMSPQNLVRIRKGLISISWDAADGIEDALQWERGSIEAAVLHGRKPSPTTPPEPALPALLAVDDPDGMPPDWSEEEEQRYVVARETLHALKIRHRSEFTRQRWRTWRDEYDKLAEVERSKAHVTPGDRS